MGQERNPIYKPTHLSQAVVDKLKPLMESAFADELSGFVGGREKLKKERLELAARQYGNRMRVAQNTLTSPLFEDSKIFGSALGSNVGQLFESVSMPSNIVSMGNIQSPGNPTTTPNGMWNPNYSPGSGDIPSYVFGLQSNIAMHSQGFDLLPTIAVDTPKIMLNYVDTVYGGGELDGEDDYPTIIEIASKYFTHKNVKELGLKRSKSKVVLWDGTEDAVEVLFYVGSLEKPAINVEVLGFGKSTDGITVAKADGKTLVSVIEKVNAAGAGAKVFVDGAAASVAIEAGQEFKLNYVSATRTNIAEAATNNNSKVMDRNQHRKGPKNKLNIVTMDKEVHIKGIEIEADTDNIQIRDMAAMGVSVISMLYAGVQNQLIQSIDEYILNHLYALGVEHAINAYESQGENFNLYIANPSKASVKLSDLGVTFDDMRGVDRSADMGDILNSIQSSGYENQTTHADRLYARILLVSEFVGQQNRDKTPDYIVIPGKLAATIKKNSTYTVVPTPNTMAVKPELHYTGTIFETLSVYKNVRTTQFSDPRILLGVRGDDTDSGAKFLAYDLAASRQTIAEGTMAEAIRAWSRFEIADVGFYPEMKYFTFVAINEYGWA